MEKGASKNNLMLKVWFALKRCMVIFITIILLGTAGGLVIGFTKKPNYIAKQEVVFTAKAIENGNAVINHNITAAYANTVIDFCDEGVVIDRANYYYVTYIQRTQAGSSYLDENNQYSVSEFIEDIETVEDPYSTSETVVINREYIIKENVSVSAKVETSEENVFAFTISYSDPEVEQAKIKARIYILALQREIQPAPNSNDVKYFDGININIANLSKENPDTTNDVSKLGYAAKGFIVGLLVASFIVYLINVTDVTIKNKDDLEELTGTTVLAFINDQGGKK